MFIIIVFDRVLTISSLVSSQDFYCSLKRDQSRDVTPRVLPFAYASSFRLLLLRLCNNRCAEAIVVNRNSQLEVKQQK